MPMTKRKSIVSIAIILLTLLIISSTFQQSFVVTDFNNSTSAEKIKFSTPKRVLNNDISQTVNNAKHEAQIAIIVDTRTGYDIYAQQYKDLLEQFFFNVSIINFPDILNGFVKINDSFDAVIIDPSVGSLLGASVDDEEAKTIISWKKYTLLIGSAHGVIDRLEGISSSEFTLTQVTNTTIVEEFSSIYIFNIPLRVDRRIGIIKSRFRCDLYKVGQNSHIYPILLNKNDNSSIVLATYHNPNTMQRILWFAPEDLGLLNENGKNLFVNIVSWIAYRTRLKDIADRIQAMQVLDNESYLGYGSFVFSKTPSLQNTYFYVKTMKELNWISKVAKSDIIGYIISRYNTHGFFYDLYVEVERYSEIVATGYAIATLAELNAVNEINTTRVISFISASQGANGGFNANPNSSDTETIYNTWGAILALSIIDPVFSGINLTAVVNFIKSLQDLDVKSDTFGGFKDRDSSFFASMRSTYFAVETLSILGKLDNVDVNAISLFVNNCEKSDGHFENIPNIGGYATAEAVMILDKIDRITSIDNKTLTTECLQNLQNIDGGFGDFPNDYYSEPFYTYIVIHALSILDSTPKHISDLEKFLTSVETPEGGIANSRFIGDIWQTYLALTVIHLLGFGTFNNSAVKQYLNNSFYDTPDESYFYFTAYRDGSIQPDAIYNTRFWGISGGIITYFGIIASKYSDNYALISEIKDKVISALGFSQITDHANEYYGMFKQKKTIFLPNDINTRFETTIFSILALEELDNISLIDTLATRYYLNSCYVGIDYPQAKYYNSVFFHYNDSAYELFTTYYTLEALRVIGGINSTVIMLANKTAYTKINYMDITSIYFAIKIWKVLEELNAINNYKQYLNETKILETLETAYRKDGLISLTNYSSLILEETAMSIEILKDLDLIDLYDKPLYVSSSVQIDKDSYKIGESVKITGFVIDGWSNPLYNANIEIIFLQKNMYAQSDELGYFDISIALNDIECGGEQELYVITWYGDMLPSIYTTTIFINASLILNIFTDKLDYKDDEILNITIRITTVTGSPIDNASVIVRIKENDKNVSATNIGNGNYTASFALTGLLNNVTIEVIAQYVLEEPIVAEKQVFVYSSNVEMTVKSNLVDSENETLLNLNVTVHHPQMALNGTLAIYIDDQFISNVSVTNNFATFNYSFGNVLAGTYSVLVIFIPENTPVDLGIVTYLFTVQFGLDLVSIEVNTTTIYATQTVLFNITCSEKFVSNASILHIFINNTQIRTENVQKQLLIPIKFHQRGSYMITFIFQDAFNNTVGTFNKNITVYEMPTKLDLDIFESVDELKVKTMIRSMDNKPLSGAELIVKMIWPDNFTEIKLGYSDLNGTLILNFEKRNGTNVTVVVLFHGNLTYADSAKSVIYTIKNPRQVGNNGLDITLGGGLIISSLVAAGLIYRRIKKLYKIILK